MIEAELGLFEVKVEGMFWHSAEACEASFCEAPEAFDSVDVVGLLGEDVVAMLDAEVLIEAEIDEPVIAAQPSV